VDGQVRVVGVDCHHDRLTGPEALAVIGPVLVEQLGRSNCVPTETDRRQQ
jgi:hypothetical protein